MTPLGFLTEDFEAVAAPRRHGLGFVRAERTIDMAGALGRDQRERRAQRLAG